MTLTGAFGRFGVKSNRRRLRNLPHEIVRLHDYLNEQPDYSYEEMVNEKALPLMKSYFQLFKTNLDHQ